MARTLSLDELLHEAGFKESEVRQVHEGKLVNSIVESTSERELAAQMAFLIHAPASVLRQIYTSSPLKKEFDPSVAALGNISGEGSLQDFAAIKLDPNADSVAKAYLHASPGSVFNLAKNEIHAFKTLGNKSDKKLVEACFHEILLDHYRAYRKEGLAGILPYARSGGKDFRPGDELKHQIEMASILERESPSFHRHLIDYPNARPEGLDEYFFWVNSVLDEKPTVALVHQMGLLDGDVYSYMERYFYVSRSHNSVQGVGGAFPVPDGSTVVYYRSRTSTDQVSGFGGSAKRAIGARMMGSKIAGSFERAREIAGRKQELEAATNSGV